MSHHVNSGNSEFPLPRAQELGLSGSAAHIYDAQLMLLQTLEKPEYFVDMSLMILNQTDLAIAEAEPAQHLRIRLLSQQVIAHHCFMGRAFMDFLVSKNKERLLSDLAPFFGKITSDILASASESGAKSVGNGGIVSPKAAAAAACVSALNAVSKRFEREGANFFTNLIGWFTEGRRIREEKKRWLASIEALLDAVAARTLTLGPAPAVADVGRRFLTEIVTMHVNEWEEQRFKMRSLLPFVIPLAGCMAFIVIISAAIFLVLVILASVSALFGHTPAFMDKFTLPDATVWLGIFGITFGSPMLWAGILAIRRYSVMSSAQNRIRRWISIIEKGG